MSERILDTTGRYKINQILFNYLLEKHGFKNPSNELKLKIKNVVRDYCSEDLIETLIAVNSMKRNGS